MDLLHCTSKDTTAQSIVQNVDPYNVDSANVDPYNVDPYSVYHSNVDLTRGIGAMSICYNVDKILNCRDEFNKITLKNSSEQQRKAKQYRICGKNPLGYSEGCCMSRLKYQ